MDITKVLDMLAQLKETPEPLENIEQRRLEISYITKTGKVERRAVKLILPTKSVHPMPLVYIAHR